MTSQPSEVTLPVPLSAHLIDPRDVDWEITAPVFRVEFWSQGADRDHVPREKQALRCDTYRLTGASDVRDVMAWARDQSVDATRTAIYVESSAHTSLGLIMVAQWSS
jgi:hypothetical protein